jgi:hypothetical protein
MVNFNVQTVNAYQKQRNVIGTTTVMMGQMKLNAVTLKIIYNLPQYYGKCIYPNSDILFMHNFEFKGLRKSCGATSALISH